MVEDTMRILYGRKAGMTQVFKDGVMIPVTVIEAAPMTVVDHRTLEKNGYTALVVGFEDVKESRVTKPMLGIFKKAGVAPKRYLREIPVTPEELAQYAIGSTITVELFKPGDMVDVTGRTKGRGFQGGVKRHGFRGFPDSHGHRYHRAGGSLAASSFPSRVFKGKRMPGHMGTNQVTIQNLEVVDVRPDSNVLLVKGAVPGAIRSLLRIKDAARLVIENA
jgi:large subunit ribosomal protein L3